MSIKSRNYSLSPKKTFVQNYANFRGVDLSNNQINVDTSRSPMCLNMCPDENGFPCKRPGWRMMQRFSSGAINGIWQARLERNKGSEDETTAEYVDVMIVHAGNRIYILKVNTIGAVTSIQKVVNEDGTDMQVQDRRSAGFTHDGEFFLLDGKHYRKICMPTEEEEYVGKSVTPYIPTTGINGYWMDTGVQDISGEEIFTWVEPEHFEEMNLLVSKRYNTFAGDGINKYFFLDSSDVDVYRVEIYKEVPLEGSTTARPSVMAKSGQQARIFNWYKWIKEHVGDKITYRTTLGYISGTTKLLILDSDTEEYNGYYKVQWETGATGFVKATDVTATTMQQPDKVKHEWVRIASSKWKAEQDLEADKMKITFTTAPDPMAEGAGFANIRVAFREKDDAGDPYNPDRWKILKCTMAERYGYYNRNRIFLSGNDATPATDYMSEVDDPTYFPATGWTQIGEATSRIMGYVKVGDSLAVMKESGASDAGIYMRTGQESSDGSVIFPLKQGTIGKGAISTEAIGVTNDRPFFLSYDGLSEIGITDVSKQTAVRHVSGMVDGKLKNEELKDACAGAWGDLYIIAVDGRAYVMDSSTNEWYLWDNIPATIIYGNEGKLFFGTVDGRLCCMKDEQAYEEVFADGTHILPDGTMDEEGEAIRAMWATKLDYLGASGRNKCIGRNSIQLMMKPYKKTGVRTIVRTDGDVHTASEQDVYTDTGTNYYSMEIGTEPKVITINNRARMFRALQLIFENDTYGEGMCLYGAEVTFSYGRKI